MPTFVGQAPTSLPSGPVFTPPDSTAPDDAEVTHEFTDDTIDELNAFIEGVPNGAVVGLPAAGSITGGASDQVILTSRSAITIVGRGCTIERT